MVAVCEIFGWTFAEYRAQRLSDVDYAWALIQARNRGHNARTPPT